MPAIDFEAYWKCIEVIEAQEMMKNKQVASYPYMKKDCRQKFNKALDKRASIKFGETKEKYLSAEETAREIMRVMNNG